MSRTARIFKNGRNQAVRIPVDLSFNADEVTIEKQGDALVLRPIRSKSWASYLDDPRMILPEDFETGPDTAPEDRDPFA